MELFQRLVSELTQHPLIVPIISLVAGIVILIVPKILNYIVAFYLIIMGIIGFTNHFQ
jgi:hypothetical protein